MTELIKKLLIKDHQNVESPIVRARYGAVAGVVGIVTNLLLAAAKMVIGLLFGTISVVADGVNNLTDSLSSIITLVGFRMSAAQADEEHPYGHGRMEYIAAMLISMLMAVVGFSLAQESFPKILHPDEPESSPLLFITLILSIGVKLWQGLFYRKMGRTIESDTLRANFRDSINDVISTTAVLFSITITPLIGYNTDGVMGVAVALFIMYSGVMLMKDTIQPLLGEGVDRELAQKIGDAVLAYDGIVGVHDLEVHNYGPGRIFASVHAEVPAEIDVLISHDIIDNVERELRERMGIHLTIHLDPIVTNDLALETLREELRAIIGAYERVSFHDLRIVRGTTHTNVLFDIVVPFHYPISDKELCGRIETAIRERHPDFYAVITVDKDLVKNSQKH